MIVLRPLDLDAANDAVRRWHRHHKPVQGAKIADGAFVDGELVGAFIMGRPVAPALQNETTWEVTRLVTDGTMNVASRLLGAAWRAAGALGIRRLISYIRADEDGHCYRVAGWVSTALTEGKAWTSGNKADRWLPGLYEPTTEIIDRVRWEIGPDAATTRVYRDEHGTWTALVAERKPPGTP